MARIPFPGFVAGSYTTRSIVHGSERLVNLYLEQNPSTQQPALYGTPGTQALHLSARRRDSCPVYRIPGPRLLRRRAERV